MLAEGHAALTRRKDYYWSTTAPNVVYPPSSGWTTETTVGMDPVPAVAQMGGKCFMNGTCVCDAGLYGRLCTSSTWQYISLAIVEPAHALPAAQFATPRLCALATASATQAVVIARALMVSRDPRASCVVQWYIHSQARLSHCLVVCGTTGIAIATVGTVAPCAVSSVHRGGNSGDGFRRATTC